MLSIKRYLSGLAVALVALLLAIVGVQRRTIDRQKVDEAKRDAALQRATADELKRREQAQFEAYLKAQMQRDKAEQAMREGRRNYFEQD